MAEENKAEDNKSIKEIKVGDYTFTADLDRLDDVEAFEIIDAIENRGRIAAIVTLLELLVGREEYVKLRDHFAVLDAQLHSETEGYKGRMRLDKLNEVYMAIIEKYDPKG